VYRSDNLLGIRTPISGWQTGTFHDDTSVITGTVYIYQVKAVAVEMMKAVSATRTQVNLFQPLFHNINRIIKLKSMQIGQKILKVP